LPVLYIDESEVRRLLPMADCIERVRAAFRNLAAGEASNQPRRRLILPTRSVLHYMAGAVGNYFGIKVYSTNPQHGARFLFLLYRAADAKLLAIMDANYLGQIRTGAASALATSLLAREDARTLGIVGTGFQARSQLEAIAAVTSLDTVLVWSRSQAKREVFARETDRLFGVAVRVAGSVEETVRAADILVTATTSKDPVLESQWVKPGTHINAIGSNNAQRRELPEDLIARASVLVVDDREQSRMESGDLLMALKEDDWSRTLELKDLFAKPFPRTGSAELSIFKSNGMAVEDVAAASLVYERALAEGAGRKFYS
jgi:ornithine cyclodeaminase/alanine dehydrogenase-like protein (mu-crystallin family)